MTPDTTAFMREVMALMEKHFGTTRPIAHDLHVGTVGTGNGQWGYEVSFKATALMAPKKPEPKP